MYAKLIDQTTIYTNPPRSATIDGAQVVGELPETYLNSQGWYRLETTPAPDTQDGYHAEARYAYDDADTPTRIVQSWDVVPDPPPPPRTFRRSYLAQWIRANGKWEAFSAFLEQPEAADLKFMWEYCTEFDEDNGMWGQAAQALKAAMGLSDAEVESMLRYGETGQAGQTEAAE